MIWPRKCRKTGAASALVKMSACCCAVGTQRSVTAPRSTVSVTKWYFTSTCFVRSPLTPLALTAMADWLSPYTVLPVCVCRPSSCIRPRSHSTSWVAAASAYSSASHVDSATTRCFLLLQLTGSPLSLATQPVIERRSPLSFAQSASEKAHTSTWAEVRQPRESPTPPPLREPNTRPTSFVPAR
jgi:hypothetical protein